MPELREAPQVQDVDLEQEQFVTALQEMRDAYALTLVRQTFWHFDNFRQQNHDRRWNTNDALYLGWRPQEVWPGTTTPRASWAQPIVFDQIEAALPSILQALFGSQPDWFQVEADEGGDPVEAQSIQAHLLYLLDHDKDEFGLTARNDIAMAVKSMLLYGNGGVAIEWDATKKRPQISWVDNRDMYFDSAAPMPHVDACRSVMRRSHRTVEEIRGWRGMPGMRIPSDEVLWGMANNRLWASGDQTKQVQSSLLGVNFAPGATDRLPNPSDRQIEVLTYYTRSRIIVVLNREWVAYVEKNPYDFIPFAFAPCYTVPGKFYSLAIPDVQEGNQRVIEALINGRLDEISLALHPPRVQSSKSNLTPAQQRFKPGAMFRVPDPKNDVQLLQPTPVTTNVYDEIDYIERSAEKRTGINALGQGVPRPSNANRTASGMQMQLQGSANRLQTLVQHVEDYMLIPMLYKMQKMIRLHAEPMQVLPGRTPDGQSTKVAASSFRKPVNFKILASSQMVTREKLAGIFPTLIQFFAQGPLVQGLVASGLAVDWEQMFKMMQDATGVGKVYRLVRPMNEQEKQAASQPPPDVQAEMQIAREKNQTELQKEQMKAAGSPMEMEAEKMKLEMEMMKEQMKLQIEQQKMELEKEKAQLQMQIKRMEMQMKAQELQMKQVFGQAEMQQDFQLKTQQAQLDSELQQQQHAMNMQQSQQQAEMSNEQAQASHDQKMTMTKEQGDLKRSEMKATSATKARLNSKGREMKPRPGKR